LSGKSEAALTAQAGRLLAHLQTHPQTNAADVGVTLARRSIFEHRAVVLGSDRTTLQDALAGLAAGCPGEGVISGRVGSVGKTVLVFPGQGSQWAGMGAQLLDDSPVFAEQMRLCSEALAPLVDWSLLDV